MVIMTQLEQLKSILDQGGEPYNETEYDGKTYLQIIMSENIICFYFNSQGQIEKIEETA